MYLHVIIQLGIHEIIFFLNPTYDIDEIIII